MKPIDTTAAAQTDAISFDFDLYHSPAKVWRALTDPQLLAEWLLPVAGLALERGTRFTFAAPPQPGWDGIVHCRLLDCDTLRKLTYTWVVGDIDTVVTFVLTPTDTGTRLSLVQSGFKEDQKRNFGGARYGWNMMGEKLFAVLDRIA